MPKTDRLTEIRERHKRLPAYMRGIDQKEIAFLLAELDAAKAENERLRGQAAGYRETIRLLEEEIDGASR